MKLTEKVVVFNAQLLGMFIEVKGTDHEGRDVHRRGIITRVEKDSLTMLVVQSSEYYSKTSVYESRLFYSQFFKQESKEGEDHDPTFYELYVFTESQKVEVEEE